MKTILRLEELGMFLLAIIAFSMTGYAWWWFPVLLLLPDIFIIGYLVDAKVGSILYNTGHHKGVAILVYLAGFYLANPFLELVGIILFAHSSMDRIFGYGLKFDDSFKHTHLGWIGDGEVGR